MSDWLGFLVDAVTHDWPNATYILGKFEITIH